MRVPATRLASLLLLAVAAACSDAPTGGAPSDATALARPLHDAATYAHRFLACPRTDPATASATIGALGGTIIAGPARLTIPAGAVLAPTTFEVSVPAGDVLRVDLHATGRDRFDFVVPVSVALDYAACGPLPAGAALHAVYIEPLGLRALEEMPSALDADARTVRFATGHFSSYVVAY